MIFYNSLPGVLYLDCRTNFALQVRKSYNHVVRIEIYLQSNVTYPTTSGPGPCWITDTIFFYVGLLCIAACTCIVLLYYMFCAVRRRLPKSLSHACLITSLILRDRVIHVHMYCTGYVRSKALRSSFVCQGMSKLFSTPPLLPLSDK